MDGKAVTNAPNLIYTNTPAYTNTAALAAAALPKAGGTMTGDIDFGAHSPTNVATVGFTNGWTHNVGALNGTNGAYWTANGTNWWILFVD